MSPSSKLLLLVFCLTFFIGGGILAACAPAMTEAPSAGENKSGIEKEVEGMPSPTFVAQEPAVEAEEPFEEAPQEFIASPTPVPAFEQPTPVPTSAQPAPTALVEARLVELEWPERIYLGDSDIVRLSLIPSEDGYTIRTDFPEHATELQPLQVTRLGGYELFAAARLEGVGFTISPTGEQEQFLPPDETLTWQWSLQPRAAGQQRLAIFLLLRWVPLQGGAGSTRENVVYTRGLDIQVASFFGMTRSQAMTGGIFGLLLGGGLVLTGLVLPSVPRLHSPQPVAPNLGLVVEPQPGLVISPEEETLLRALFRRYARLVLEREFLSGYSGARTFLVRPIQADGRADAATIVKMGQPAAVQSEFDNYERYVKDTLPPITARIQHPPVTFKDAALGAIQYTFIGTSQDVPFSLRQALLKDPDPAYLDKLFTTFGPNWWMQRKPYTFRLALEYDRLLPTHLILEPAAGHSLALDPRTSPETLEVKLGDLVTLHDFPSIEYRPDGRSLSLHGLPLPGQPELRLRWLSLSDPRRATGRVVATRESQLRDFCQGFDLYGLPDPMPHIPPILARTVSGSQATIHGDLNLENILIGPGGIVWLIDFAQTRDGHTLFDFAHLGAEIIAHIIAPQVRPSDYVDILSTGPFSGAAVASGSLEALLAALNRIAGKCLLNPSHPQEFHLALCLACLGALKYPNLEASQKHLLYLTAAHLCSGFKT